MAANEILGAPHKVPQHYRKIIRPQPKVLASLIEGEQAKRRQRESQQPQTPVWRAGLQDHGCDANVPAAQPRLCQRIVVAPVPADVIFDPLSLRRGEFGYHYEGQLGKDALEGFESPRDDCVGAGGEENLDGARQISCDSSKHQRSASCCSHNSSAWRQKPVETGLEKGSSSPRFFPK